MCANSEGSVETARMLRLAWAFAHRLCDKYHNLMSWFLYCSMISFQNATVTFYQLFRKKNRISLFFCISMVPDLVHLYLTSLCEKGTEHIGEQQRLRLANTSLQSYQAAYACFKGLKAQVPFLMWWLICYLNHLRRKRTKWPVRPVKTQISLCILPSQIRLFAVRMKKVWVLNYQLSAHRRLIRLGKGPGWSESSLGAVILLVLSLGGSYNDVITL